MSLSYLVDTDWAINHLNGQQRTRRRLEEFVAGGLGFSTISLAEAYEGIYYSSDPEGKPFRRHDDIKISGIKLTS